jgi:hypothetical protein
LKADKPVEKFYELTEEKETPPGIDEMSPELQKWYRQR